MHTYSCHINSLYQPFQPYIVKGKAVPLQAWSGPEGSGKLILILIHLSIAIGLAPGGSTHLHAIHRTSQLTTKQHE
jgi:hypothetical protein